MGVNAIKDAGCYTFQCVCGARIISANPIGVCFDCQREFQIDWHGKYVPPSNPQSITAKYEDGKP